MENENQDEDLEQRIKKFRVKQENLKNAVYRNYSVAFMAFFNMLASPLEAAVVLNLDLVDKALNYIQKDSVATLAIAAAQFEIFALSAAVSIFAEKRAERYEAEFQRNDKKYFEENK